MALSRHPGSRPVLSRSLGNQSGTPTLLSLAAPDDGFIHRRSLRARSPFTRPCRCFCSAYAELIRDQTPPDDFCNCLRRAGNQTLRLSLPSQGRWPRPSSFSYSTRLLPCESGAERRAARRSPRKPRCWFVPLAQGCPAAMPPRAPRHPRFYPAMHSEDQRARVEGPSEGRVPWRMRRCLVPASGAYA